MTLTLREYLPVKQLMEAKALQLQNASPLNAKGRHMLHLADASTLVHVSNPGLDAIYKQAIASGHPSEFQRPKRPPSRPSPADRVYFEIERIARRIVALSSEPMTLRTAVARVVELQPELLDRYRDAIRRSRGASGR